MKGIVMEIRDQHCVILKEDGTFVKIRNKNYQPGQAVTHRNLRPVISVVAVAACLMLICTAAFAWFTPASYVYMDVNPSVRIEVNYFGRVLDVVPLNADAEALLQETPVDTGSLEDCMEQLWDSCADQGYGEKKTVSLYVCTDQKGVTDAVTKTADRLEQQQVRVNVYSLSREENDYAIRKSIPASRLRAVKRYTHWFGGSLDENMAKLKGVSSREIHKMIEEKRSGSESD